MGCRNPSWIALTLSFCYSTRQPLQHLLELDAQAPSRVAELEKQLKKKTAELQASILFAK